MVRSLTAKQDPAGIRRGNATHPRLAVSAERPAPARTALMKLGLLALSAALLPAAARAGKVIEVTTTIQAAVDAASPGDTVLVPPGTYHESVLVQTSPITIRGSQGAVLDAEGFNNGISVRNGGFSQGPDGFPVCPGLTLHDVAIEGLTIRNAERNGVLLLGVDGFRVSGGKYLENEEYGIFPICSRNGLIDSNRVEGTEDAGIYVGDDDEITVVKNHVARCTIGIEIENSTGVVVRDNRAIGNTTGILVVVLPGLPVPFTEDVLIENNVVVRNNFPNPVPADSGEPEGLLPTGTGILNIGGDRVVIRDNVVNQNDSLGIAILANPFAALDPRLEPFPDGNEVRGNVILQNGQSPDPERAQTPGADVVYDGTGTGNCFAENIFETEFPEGITEIFPCS
jgi:parallel beta-helix repeat protein